jgi:hypothetical protein
MKRTSRKTNIPTLASMTVIFRRRHFKRAKGCARIYMTGFNDAKKRYKK